MTMLRVQVAAIRPLTPRIKAFELRPVDGAPLPAPTPGCHIELPVVLPDGSAAMRAYSVLNDTTDRYDIAVLREVAGRGGSAFLHDRVAVGKVFEIKPPDNDFPLAQARPALLIAGGIGITPILAMARHLVSVDRAFALHYSARSPTDMAFRETIEAVAGNRARFYFDGGDPRRGIDLAAVLAGCAADTVLYVCGPKGMIDATIVAATAAGWPRERVRFELFATAATDAADGALEVVLKRSGRTVTVGAGTTILDALVADGLEPMFDCKRGECGVCTTDVVSGTPIHRDYYLTEAERASGKLICICVSRAAGGRIVLDL